MTFPDADFFQSLLSLPFSSISYTAQKLLSDKSGRNVIQCSDEFFNVHEFAGAGQCKLTLSDRVVAEIKHNWDPAQDNGGFESYWDRPAIPLVKDAPVDQDWEKLSEVAEVAWYNVDWPGSRDGEAPNRLEVVLISIPEPRSCARKLKFLLSDSYQIGARFVVAVQKLVSQMQNRIWVFEEGRWQASIDMYKAVTAVNFDNLVMTADKGAAVKQDMELFFKSQRLYEEFGLPWKRGYLLTGPPGNGKTHLVKALINHITSIHPQVAPLYVKSFKVRWASSDHHSIAEVFKRARQRACILVLEDLDTLVTDTNRAIFLNELDGFHSNHGVVVIATTNHPEKLDPALSDRPSRFDRRYQFDLPDAAEREMQLDLWSRNAKHADMSLTQADVKYLAADEVTGGFSYAYMKELLLSGAMQIVQKHVADTGEGTGVEAALQKSGTANGIADGTTAADGTANGTANGTADGKTAADGTDGTDAGGEGELPRSTAVPPSLSAFGQIVAHQAVVLRKYIKECEKAAAAKLEKERAAGEKPAESASE